LKLAVEADDARRIDRHGHGVARIGDVGARERLLARAIGNELDALRGEAL